jgi:hypothetical protein
METVRPAETSVTFISRNDVNMLTHTISYDINWVYEKVYRLNKCLSSYRVFLSLSDVIRAVNIGLICSAFEKYCDYSAESNVP